MARWTLEKIKKGFERFYEENEHYPTAHEIDASLYLPSSRQIQRRFGGLPSIRALLKLSGQTDFTKGEYSSQRAHVINKRAHAFEQGIYEYLVKCFGKEFVHREYFFVDDRRTRTDFFVYCKNGNFSVDVFYPNSLKNLTGCLNSKMRAYKTKVMIEYPVIFLMMNIHISEEEVQKMLARKKRLLHTNQRVMTLEQFKKFCPSKKRLVAGA